MTPLAIEAAGAMTSVGSGLPQTATSLRTRLQRFAELDIVAPDMEPVVGAAAPFPLDEVQGDERLLALAVPALAECRAADEHERAPLLLCAPEDFPEAQAAGLLSAIAQGAGLAIDPGRSRVLPGGRAGTLVALGLAGAALASGTARTCYVGGVDCLVDDDALFRALDAERVKHGQNPNGFIPGEASAFLRLSLCPSPGTMALVTGVASAAEPMQRPSGRPSSAAGLGRAMREALAAARLELPAVSWLVHDGAGDRYDAKELALAVLRLPFDRKQTFVQWEAATCVGEVGAAASALALAYVAFALQRGFAPGPAAMVVGRSSGDLRAAAVVERASGGKG